MDYSKLNIKNIKIPSVTIDLEDIFHPYFLFLASKGIKTIEYGPVDNSILFSGESKQSSLFLKCDGCICPTTIRDNCWEKQSFDFFHFALEKSNFEKIILIDIGANIGLFTRQIISTTNKVDNTFCYEPSIENYKLLVKNTEFSKKIITMNSGLGTTSKKQKLYLDKTNCGNNSVFNDMIPDKNKIISETIDILSTKHESYKWIKSSLPIFWKSDTQGMDEIIATNVPLEVWKEYIFAGAMELLATKEKQVNTEKLIKILDLFSYKVFDDKPTENLNTKYIIEYLEEDIYKKDKAETEKNLVFWR
tara:strand:+ start:1265 stop:2179 length:915 start_codon:yes stop_codon:yes gene_type:complete